MRMTQRVHLAQRQQRGSQREPGQRLAQFKKMRPRPQAGVHLQHHRLAQRIDGRIGHLRKSLPEKCVKRPRRAGQWRNRSVVAHGPHCILALGGHGLQNHAHIFARKSEAVLQTIQFRRLQGRWRLQRVFQRLVDLNQVLVMALRIVNPQYLVVLEEAIEVEIGNDHLAGPKPAAMHDVCRIHIHQASFGSGNNKSLCHPAQTGMDAVHCDRESRPPGARQ